MLLCGFFPFQDDDKEKLTQEITVNKIKFPKGIWNLVSREALLFVSNLLHKNPEERMNFEEMFRFPWFSKLNL